MHWLSLLFMVMLHTRTIQSLDYSCSSDWEACPAQAAQSEFKYFFFEVSHQEGFNLRRDVYMRYAIMFAEMHKRNKRLNWKLVLTPFYKVPHWQNENHLSKPIQWNLFFDVDSLKSYAPVIEVEDLLENKLPFLDIDRVYVLQNYENAFENGYFAEKWDAGGKCEYLLQNFWGYFTTSFETVCVKFQGKVSKLWEMISMHPHDKSVMIYHAEIPLHDSYGTKTYWDCRKSMKFNRQLIEAAMIYTAKNFQCNASRCDTYISVHWRRGDYARSRRNEVPSIKGTADQIDSTMAKLKLRTKNVFIATDADAIEMRLLQRALQAVGYEVYFYLPQVTELDKFRDGGLAIIEQIICSHAAYFIGSHESTFTYRIQEEREILGFNSTSTFNRLCPDIGNCERPSVWKIVQ